MQGYKGLDSECQGWDQWENLVWVARPLLGPLVCMEVAAEVDCISSVTVTPLLMDPAAFSLTPGSVLLVYSHPAAYCPCLSLSQFKFPEENLIGPAQHLGAVGGATSLVSGSGHSR